MSRRKKHRDRQNRNESRRAKRSDNHQQSSWDDEQYNTNSLRDEQLPFTPEELAQYDSEYLSTENEPLPQEPTPNYSKEPARSQPQYQAPKQSQQPKPTLQQRKVVKESFVNREENQTEEYSQAEYLEEKQVQEQLERERYLKELYEQDKKKTIKTEQPQQRTSQYQTESYSQTKRSEQKSIERPVPTSVPYQQSNPQAQQQQSAFSQREPITSSRRHRTRYRKQETWKLLVPITLRVIWIQGRRFFFHLPKAIMQGLRDLNRNMFLDPDVMRSSYIVPDEGSNTIPNQLVDETENRHQYVKATDQPVSQFRPRRNMLYRSQRRKASRWFPPIMTAGWIGARRKLHHFSLACSEALNPPLEQYRSSMMFPSSTLDNSDREDKSYGTIASLQPSISNERSNHHFGSTSETQQRESKIQPVAATSFASNRTYGNSTTSESRQQNSSSSHTTTRSAIVRRQRKSSPFVWQMMGVAGVIGIILMLLQPFHGEDLPSKPLSISATTPKVELQFQLAHFVDLEEKFELLSFDPSLRQNVSSRLVMNENDYWNAYKEYRKDDAILEAAYFSPLGETTDAPLARTKNSFQNADQPATSLSAEMALESVVIEKNIPREVIAYQPFEYLLVVRNNTKRLQENIVVEENIIADVDLLNSTNKPAPYRITQVTPAAYHSGQTLRWDIQQLQAGESKEFRVRMLPLQTGSFKTISTWSAPTSSEYVAFATNVQAPVEPTPRKPRPAPLPLIKKEPAPKIPSFPTPEPEPKPVRQPEQLPIVKEIHQLKLDLKTPTQVSKGRNITLLVKVSNVGNRDAKNVVVSYNVPAELVCKLGKKLEWEIENLPAGKSKVGSITLRAEVTGNVRNDFLLKDDRKTFGQQSRSLVVTKPVRTKSKFSSTPSTDVPNPCECLPSFISQ